MKLLVVEDDPMLSCFLRDALLDDGHDVCGIAASVTRAVDLALLFHPDVIILDIELQAGERGTEVPERLAACGDYVATTGFVYMTGGIERLDRDWIASHQVIRKPYTMATLNIALQRASNGRERILLF